VDNYIKRFLPRLYVCFVCVFVVVFYFLLSTVVLRLVCIMIQKAVLRCVCAYLVHVE